MYLNRFTISASPNNSIPIEKLKPFNLIYSEIEEKLFEVMPKKINVGGYGYVSIKLHNDESEKDWVKEYGQCVDCNLYSYKFDIENFLRKNMLEQWNEVLQIYETGLRVLSSKLKVDETSIVDALNHIKEENKTHYNSSYNS